MVNSSNKPLVVFVCSRNRGKSQMAEALFRARVGDSADVVSAGAAADLDPAKGVNQEAAAVCAEIGADMSEGHPKPLDEELQRRADHLVVLGSEAVVAAVPGQKAEIVQWTTDEPSHRGIEGMARMRLVRDDIARRVDSLVAELSSGGTASVPAMESLDIGLAPPISDGPVCGPDGCTPQPWNVGQYHCD